MLYQVEKSMHNPHLNDISIMFIPGFVQLACNIQAADRTTSSFVDSSAQHRENEAEPGGNDTKICQNPI